MIGEPDADAGSRLRFEFWSFREDVHLETSSPGDTVVVYSRWEETYLPLPSARVLEALMRMSLGPIALANVITNDAENRELEVLLKGLKHLVVRSFGLDPAQPLISVVPLTPQAAFTLPTSLPVRPVRLSRFALISTNGNQYLIESPLALHRVILHSPDIMSQLGPLIRPVDPTKVEHLQSVVTYLMAAGMVVQAEGTNPDGTLVFAEDTDPALISWNPIDLMFHTRSTLGRHDHDFGATYPLGERAGVEPVVKPARKEGAITLPRPKWNELLTTDPPFTVAVEAAQNTRSYSEQPMTADELGELLYRTTRVRSLTESTDPNSMTSTSDRPYLSSGVSYELELYVTAGSCTGVPRGIYHYDPFDHRLEPIEADQADLDELLEKGRVEANLTTRPPVILVVTARFRRLSWKYDGLGYSLVLKNVGALTQTLSLVSTAMGLASSGLDSSDIEASPRIFGIDWRIESAVGGFAVGHRGPIENASPPIRAVNDAGWVAQARAKLS
ncbi:MAG TPA: SagB family peptide dehydrogenase [Kineosporiaceae bacterium]|nr:SagB family peptide dehydrogenase [Kineosporiaceae bacterium]